LFDETEAAIGPVDELVNNAGMIKVSPVADVTDADFERVIAVNLTGTFNGMREGARRVRRVVSRESGKRLAQRSDSESERRTELSAALAGFIGAGRASAPEALAEIP